MGMMAKIDYKIIFTICKRLGRFSAKFEIHFLSDGFLRHEKRCFRCGHKGGVDLD